MKITTVLCPIDFSPITKRVVALSIQTCQLFGSRLVLHYSMEGPKLDLPHVRDKEPEDLNAAELLQEMAARTPVSIHAEARVTKGQASKSILELAEKLPADLIVMGTHGRSGLSHMLLGSTTERVVAQSHCPVLATRDVGHNILLPERGDFAANGPAQVLVPIDFSEHSSNTLEQAYGMMDALPITIHLLHVVEPVSWDDMRGATHFNVPEFQGHLMHDARERLRSLIPRDLEGRVQSHVCKGPVVDEITGYANRIQARLIIMGIGHKGVMEQFLFGAVSYGVLRHSPCPVWIVAGPRHMESSHARRKSEFSRFRYPSPQ